MRFWKANGGLLLTLLGVLAAAGLLFLVLEGNSLQAEPEGTLVQRKIVEALL